MMKPNCRDPRLTAVIALVDFILWLVRKKK